MNTLCGLAGMEMLYHGGEPFTSADIAFRYEELFGQVRDLIDAMDHLSENRHAALATSEFGSEPGGDSYALIGTDCLNLSARFGYHFATLDTFCGEEPDHNYLSLQFSGGAGSGFGKTLHLQFLGRVLDGLGCQVSIQGTGIRSRGSTPTSATGVCRRKTEPSAGWPMDPAGWGHSPPVSRA
ncbi:MAG: hypothetical protein V1793_05935 [Pseudomonadota bacterium]